MTPPTDAANDLLLPGAQPPSSHFGVTLLRHVVITGLRYTLYHLGLELPVKAPLRIVELRLHFDPRAVAGLLGTSPEGEAVARALIEPGGTAEAGEVAPAGAAFFHRQRLRWRRRRDLARPARAPEGSVAALEVHFRQQLALYLPALNDALLDEVVTALRRRADRRRGRAPSPALGAAAAAWLAGRRARRERLGPPDIYRPSWSAAVPAVEPPAAAAAARVDAGRGRFREVYRQALDALRPTALAVAEAALANGVIGDRDDLFFLPFELLDDLTASSRPPWLEAAVLRNRSEYFGLRRGASAELAAAWEASPLEPLP